MTVQHQWCTIAPTPWILIFVCILCICPPLSGGLTVPSASTRSTIPQTQKQQSQSKSQSPPPPPPWSFDVKRIYYEFRAIPVDQARRHCPPIIHQQQKKQYDKFSSSDYQPPPTTTMMLSFGGYTLGGIFCIEYESAPVGPYREVAILSSLLVDFSSRRLPLPTIGAWASHIFVDSKDAQTYGEKFWGLPAQYLENIDFSEDSSSSSVDGSNGPCSRSDKDDVGSLVLDQDNQRIGVSRWGSRNDAMVEMSFPLKISLPSFSGLLPKGSKSSIPGVKKKEGVSKSVTPLLQYPLTLQFPRTKGSKIGWIQPMTLEYSARAATVSKKGTDFSSSSITTSFLDEIQILLQNGRSLGAVSIENIQLEAGIPETLS